MTKERKYFMRERFINLTNKDFLGFMASMICAVHCAVVPVLLTLGTLGSLAWLEHPLVEMTFILISLVLAAWSLVTGYFRHHGNLTALAVVLVGFMLIIASRFVEGSGEVLLTVFGGLTIAAAHLINWNLLKTCKSCQMATS